MEIDRIEHFYNQALNWTEHRLQRYLLARNCAPQDRIAIALALLSHRLPFIASTGAELEDPRRIAEYVICNCRQVPDHDMKASISILCSIAEKYQGYGSDSKQTISLAGTCAQICSNFQHSGMHLLEALHALNQRFEQPIKT
jgi:hypothetical protein